MAVTPTILQIVSYTDDIYKFYKLIYVYIHIQLMKYVSIKYEMYYIKAVIHRHNTLTVLLKYSFFELYFWNIKY